MKTEAISQTTPVDQLPEFLTVEEFCAYFAIGKTAAYDLVRRGELAHVRFGRLVRIPKAAMGSAVDQPNNVGTTRPSLTEHPSSAFLPWPPPPSFRPNPSPSKVRGPYSPISKVLSFEVDCCETDRVPKGTGAGIFSEIGNKISSPTCAPSWSCLPASSHSPSAAKQTADFAQSAAREIAGGAKTSATATKGGD